MLEIIVCEDDEKERAFITEFIKGHIMMENLDMKVALSTADPKDLVEYVKKNARGGLYFLDVDLKSDITGIQVAIKIREYDQEASIVFITTHAELMSLTFEYAIEAMGYITKGSTEVIKEKIVKYIHYAKKKTDSTASASEKFRTKVDGMIITENYDQILSFEIATKRQSKVVMYTKTRRVEINATLSEIEKLSDKFVRCHRSCLVNIDNVKSIDTVGKMVYLTNGDMWEASTTGIKNLKKRIES